VHPGLPGGLEHREPGKGKKGRHGKPAAGTAPQPHGQCQNHHERPEQVADISIKDVGRVDLHIIIHAERGAKRPDVPVPDGKKLGIGEPLFPHAQAPELGPGLLGRRFVLLGRVALGVAIGGIGPHRAVDVGVVQGTAAENEHRQTHHHGRVPGAGPQTPRHQAAQPEIGHHEDAQHIIVLFGHADAAKDEPHGRQATKSRIPQGKTQPLQGKFLFGRQVDQHEGEEKREGIPVEVAENIPDLWRDKKR